MKKIKRFIFLSLCSILLLSSMLCISGCKKKKNDTIYRVSFIVDGQVQETKQVIENEYVVASSSPSKEGYEFVGWYDGENEFDFSTKITKDYNLVAKFITICEAKGHDWIEATPDRPKTCSRCGITEGDVLHLATKIEISVPRTTLTVGETLQVSGKITPAEASQKINWHIKCYDGAVANLDTETLILSTSKEGSLYIYATTTDGSYLESFVEIVITKPLINEKIYDAFNIMTGFGDNAATDIEINYHTHNTLTTIEYTLASDVEFKNATVVSPTTGYYFASGPEKVLVDFTPRNVMRASIKGLKPNTDYIYRINKGNDTYSEVYHIKTAKNDGSKSTFYVASDIHYWTKYDESTGKHVSHGSEISEKIFQNALNMFPEIGFFATAGDIIDQGGNLYAWEAFFEKSESLKQFARISVAGNHEYYYYDISQTDYKYQKAHTATPYNGPSTHIGASGYTVYNDILFITFDNERAIGKDVQYAWLEHVLQTVEAKYTIVMMHSPIYYPATGQNAKDHDDTLMGIFEKYCVDLAIAGHYHGDNWCPNFYENATYSDTGIGVNYITLSFGGVKSASETNRPTGYVFEVDNGHFKITRINDLGQVVSTREFDTKKHKEVVKETKETLINSITDTYDVDKSIYTLNFSNRFYGNVKEMNIVETIRGKINKTIYFPTPSYNKLVLKDVWNYYDYHFVITITFEDGTTQIIEKDLKAGPNIYLSAYPTSDSAGIEFDKADDSMDQVIKEYIVYLNGKEVARIPYLIDGEASSYYELTGLTSNTEYTLKFVAKSYHNETVFTTETTFKTTE